MLKKILPCVGEYKKYAIATPFVMMLEVLIEILMPFVMADIIDTGINGGGGLNYILSRGALMVGMALFSLACGALAGRLSAKASCGFARNLRNKLFDKVQDFSFSNIDRFSQSSLIIRMTTDVTSLQNTFMMCIRALARSPLMLIGATAIAATINFELSAVFFVAIPLIAVLLVVIGTKAYPRFMRMLRRYDKMNAGVQENLVAMRIVKAFVREDHEKKSFRERADAVREANLKAEKLLLYAMPIMQLAMYGCIIAVLWFGGNIALEGRLEIGQLSSFITYIAQIMISLMMIGMIFIMLVMARASAGRIIEVLDETSDITDENADPNLMPRDASIEFKNVSFGYEMPPENTAGGDAELLEYKKHQKPERKPPETMVLKDISLRIEPGETIGIIGGTGSGKTSLVSLIPRLYDVCAGALFVGGNDVRDYKIDVLRSCVGVVLQKNVLFSGTIRENLLWGDGEATQEQIDEACRSACAYEFIESFPQGYDTVLGQGGVNLSGGQKQRLCIARALLRKPKIVILDDSTSAVDTATDASIRAAFKEKLADTTTIIIAQRVASVMDADRIIVLDDGRVSAFGTHEELLESSHIYREVYESQQTEAA